MAVDYKKLKAGDNVRYLGGDRIDEGELIIGEDYVIEGMDDDGDPFFICDDIIEWYIYEYNAHCFELVDDEESVEESPSSCNCACKHDSHIVSLAKEVAKLKRELAEYKEYIEKEVVLFDERLAEVESKKPNGDRSQYITVYGSEYIDKLFGGDGE